MIFLAIFRMYSDGNSFQRENPIKQIGILLEPILITPKFKPIIFLEGHFHNCFLDSLVGKSMPQGRLSITHVPFSGIGMATNVGLLAGMCAVYFHAGAEFSRM
jgi:hypothetical protein